MPVLALIADASAQDMVQTSVALSAIAMVGSVAALVVGWLKDRDKLRNDSRVVALEGQVQTLTESEEECKENTVQIKADLKLCEEKHDSTDEKIQGLHEAIAKLQVQNGGKS